MLCSILILLQLACKKNKTIEIKNANGQVVLKITSNQPDTSGLKTGFYEYFDEHGVLTETSNFTGGELIGERKIYEAGKLYAIENYINGQFEGPYKVYYPNGQLKLETQYVHNEMIGELKSYYENGTLKEVVQMQSNEENGPFIEYYSDGKIKAEGFYKNGPNEHGELKLYDSTGILNRIMFCEEGICKTQWSSK